MVLSDSEMQTIMNHCENTALQRHSRPITHPTKEQHHHGSSEVRQDSYKLSLTINWFGLTTVKLMSVLKPSQNVGVDRMPLLTISTP